MTAGEPSWWYDTGGRGVAQRVMAPLASLYAAAGARRFARAKPYRSRLTVICVGNFTAGGTGKSPLTADLLHRLSARRHSAAVLTRGYGGRLAGPHWVDGERDTAAEVGDEALMHAARTVVMVARDRAAGLRAIEAQAPGVSAVVMDDGLQNPGVVKDLAIAVVDARRWLGNGCVIPAGPLRMPLAAQLAFTDAVIVNLGAQPLDPAEVDRLADNRAALAARFAGPILACRIEPAAECASLAGARVLAYAGIANPQRFFGLLRRLGCDVAGQHAFADHHAFTAAEARDVLAAADRLAATPVTTEKDMARLSRSRDPMLVALAQRSVVMPVAVAFDPADAAQIETLLAAAMARRAA